MCNLWITHQPPPSPRLVAIYVVPINCASFLTKQLYSRSLVGVYGLDAVSSVLSCLQCCYQMGLTCTNRSSACEAAHCWQNMPFVAEGMVLKGPQAECVPHGEQWWCARGGMERMRDLSLTCCLRARAVLLVTCFVSLGKRRVTDGDLMMMQLLGSRQCLSRAGWNAVLCPRASVLVSKERNI